MCPHACFLLRFWTHVSLPAGQTCVLTPRDAPHRGQEAHNVETCAVDKQTAGKHQPGCHTQKSWSRLDILWTQQNTEATQLIQILSHARIIIKINFPVRQHQPTHTKKVGGKGQVGVTAKKIKQLLNRDWCKAAQASHSRDVWSIKNMLLHHGESFAALGNYGIKWAMERAGSPSQKVTSHLCF